MLFNSYQFIFVYLPIVLTGYQIAGHFSRRAVILWLGIASLAFYAYWQTVPVVCILAYSIVLNYMAAGLISRQIPSNIPPRVWLTGAIGLDLAALGFFKYLFPSLNFLASVAGSPAHWEEIILPLGISFFTFTQIAYLVDLYQGAAKHQDLENYILFVTFFPHLIAGPVLHHKEIMPQFQHERRYRLDPIDLAMGFSWFVMGLAKKVLLADSFARIANPVFGATRVSGATAWAGAVAYTFQLYFDFSGYSDMALGLARMFSIDFPLNFNSPYKAASMIDFWQRWHMTLSRYITAYLYTPTQQWVRARRQRAGKGVSRKDMSSPGAFAQMVAFPMMFTMFIAGIWHGAGLQFVLFGLLHGFYLTVNHAWRLLGPKRRPDQTKPLAANVVRAASVLVTFLCALVGFVIFRSSSVSHAMRLLAAMCGANRDASLANPEWPALLALAVGFTIVWFFPNTQQILSRFRPSLDQSVWQSGNESGGLLWRPALGWALAMGAIFFAALVGVDNPSTFLYFQF